MMILTSHRKLTEVIAKNFKFPYVLFWKGEKTIGNGGANEIAFLFIIKVIMNSNKLQKCMRTLRLLWHNYEMFCVMLMRVEGRGWGRKTKKLSFQIVFPFSLIACFSPHSEALSDYNSGELENFYSQVNAKVFERNLIQTTISSRKNVFLLKEL